MPEEPNYTEDTVATFIEHYLTLLTWPSPRFSLELFSKKKERFLGADARLRYSSIRAFKPLYLQFKRPIGYSSKDKNGNPNNRSKIIRERRLLSLSIEPIVLAFRLRDKMPHQRDFQHNILFRLRRLLRRYSVGDAVYVCPLFLDRSAYAYSIHWTGLQRWIGYWWKYWRGIPPWEWKEVILHDLTIGNSLAPLVEEIPVLEEHIVVPPHNTVVSSKHWYSFSDEGEDVCFHSPEHVTERGTRLSFWLAEISSGLMEPSRDNGFLDISDANQVLREIIRSVDMEFKTEGADWGAWLDWGAFLKDNYGIEQYAIVIRE